MIHAWLGSALGMSVVVIVCKFSYVILEIEKTIHYSDIIFGIIEYKLLNNIYVFIFTRDFDQEKWTKNLFMNKYDVDDYSLIC